MKIGNSIFYQDVNKLHTRLYKSATSQVDVDLNSGIWFALSNTLYVYKILRNNLIGRLIREDW